VAKLLIVEDDTATAEQLQGLLANSGHSCQVEQNGAAAVDQARANRPDLVLLDIMLPGGVSGFEVCRRIRRDPALYTLPILVISAMDGEEEVFHGLAQGADDYVVKPFDSRNLLQRVDALLRTQADGPGMDAATSLPDAETTKREIQRRISLSETFAIAHCELAGLRQFAKKYGADSRGKALRHLSRALAQCGQRIVGDGFFVGHMGAGHFMVVLPPANAETFCSWVEKLWNQHVDKFYASLDIPSPEAAARDRHLGVILCVTVRDPRDATTAQQVFEILSQLRQKAIESPEGGVHLDRRTFSS
jgi:DNA-binding response OmpR family regulator